MKSLFQIQHFRPAMQLLFLLLLFFIGSAIQTMILVAYPQGVLQNQTANGVFLLMIATQLCLFILPSLVFIKLLPKPLSSFLSLKKIENPLDFPWLLLLAFGTIFLVSSVATLLLKIPLGSLADSMQKDRTGLEQVALKMTSWTQIPIRLLIMALLPAIGEELFFRGLIQRFFNTLFKNVPWAIIATALAFAAFHGSVYNFLPVAIGGVILGFVYFKTGNILYNIILHFLINGIQVVISYLQHGAAEAQTSTSEALLYFCFGIIGVGISFFLLIKHKKQLDKTWGMSFEPAFKD